MPVSVSGIGKLKNTPPRYPYAEDDAEFFVAVGLGRDGLLGENNGTVVDTASDARLKVARVSA